MPTAIALIRGINVGATRPLPMQRLRDLCQEVGLLNPRTYIQSGNVIFDTPAPPASTTCRLTAPALTRLVDQLELAIESACGFRPTVILRTPDELAAAVNDNPFPRAAKTEPNRLHILFFRDTPTPTAAAAIHALPRAPSEKLHLLNRDLFLHSPDGLGKSRLQPAAIERAAATPGTARNWNTVLKLLEMGRQDAD